MQKEIREDLSIVNLRHLSHIIARVPLADPLSPDTALGHLLLKQVRAVRMQLDVVVADEADAFADADAQADEDVFEARLVKPSEFGFPFNPRCLYLSLTPALMRQLELLPGISFRAELDFELERPKWLDAALYALGSLRIADLVFPNTLPSEATLLYRKMLEIMPKYADFGCDLRANLFLHLSLNIIYSFILYTTDRH